MGGTAAHGHADEQRAGHGACKVDFIWRHTKRGLEQASNGSWVHYTASGASQRHRDLNALQYIVMNPVYAVHSVLKPNYR
jgi:hypothetical protein